MATQFTAENMAAYNRRQARAAARNVGVYHDNSVATAAIVTAVKAK